MLAVTVSAMALLFGTREVVRAKGRVRFPIYRREVGAKVVVIQRQVRDLIFKKREPAGR
jgi:hypothetical protein